MLSPVRCAPVAAILAASTVAAAHHRTCVETSDVVGYRECSRFGDRWSGGRSLSWELGAVALTLPIDPIDQPLDPVDPARRGISAGGSASATALRLRSLYGLAPHFYVASELTFGAITNAPLIAVAPAARNATSMPNETRGHVLGGMLAAGTRSMVLDHITFGTEVAFGPRVTLLTAPRAPDTLFGQGGMTLEARAHGTVWMSPHWSAGVMFATSLVERGDYSVTLALGLHAFPFDWGH